MSPFQTLLRRDLALAKLRKQIETDITNLSRLNDRRLTQVIALMHDAVDDLIDAESHIREAREEEKNGRHSRP